MRRFFIITFAFGFFVALFGIKEIYQAKIYEFVKLTQAKTVLLESKDKDEFLNNMKKNDLIGVLSLPSIDKELPILEGTTEEELLRGVGHFSRTAMPGEKKQILLSGHRDTVFTRLGEMELGDEIIINLPYGDFEYEIKEIKITDAKDPTIIDLKLDEEELVISTCYPFNFIGSAPDRYIIYAYPKEKSD